MIEINSSHFQWTEMIERIDRIGLKLMPLVEDFSSLHSHFRKTNFFFETKSNFSLRIFYSLGPIRIWKRWSIRNDNDQHRSVKTNDEFWFSHDFLHFIIVQFSFIDQQSHRSIDRHTELQWISFVDQWRWNSFQTQRKKKRAMIDDFESHCRF